MEIKSQKGGIKVNYLIITLAGLIFLISSILVYLYILRGVFGDFSSQKLIPNTKVLESVISGGEPSVAILYSKYTENMLPAGSTWLVDNVNTWKKFLSDRNFKYNIITDQTIEMDKMGKYKVIVLPGSKSLSDKEIVHLKEFLNNGGSIFATGGIASFSDLGKWRGWSFLSDVFGISYTKEIDRNSITKIHTLRGGLPITANIPAGFPLKIATWDRPIAVEVLDPRTIQASFWYNYKLQSGLSREKIKKSAGIVYGTYGKGRFVWMGFELNSVNGMKEDYIYFDRLFNNCMSWLTYQPIAFVRDWPANYDAAAIITPMLSNNINNIKNLLNVLKNNNVKATFFVNPVTAEQNKSLIRSLTKYGNIGALVDIGYLASVNDTVNVLNNFKTQKQKLKNAKKILESITGSVVRGFMPYYGLFDKNTVHALINDNYKYVMTDSLTDRAIPKTLVRGDSLLISITKTARDDYEVIRDFGLTNPIYQFYTYQEDIDRVLFEGGLYVFKPHTAYQCTPANVNVVGKIISDLKKKNYWITTAHQVEKWWAKKHFIELRVSKRGNRRVALTVTNVGHEIADDFVVQVNLSEQVKNIKINTEIIGTKIAKMKYDQKKHIVYVYINELKPSESRGYYIDFDLPNT